MAESSIAGGHRAWTELADRMVHRCAVEAVIWGMPAVNFDLMFQAMVRKTGGGPNRIIYWSRLPDWQNQTLTPNPDAIYVMPFFDTRDGPVVLEIPPADGGSITGSVDSCWQTAIEDVGPAGADQGKGGRYLLTPAGYAEPIPDGYIPLPSANHQGYALLRSIPTGGGAGDLHAAVAYARKINLYPLAHAAAPAPHAFLDAIDVVFDATIPYDLRFFQALDRIVQAEPWLERDRAMIDTLRALGIEKGKRFDPDTKTAAILVDAASEAHDWLEAAYERSFVPTYYEDAQWGLPISKDLVEGMQHDFADPNVYPVESRGLTYSFAFFSAKRFGQGSAYLISIRDKDGALLDGAQSYRLHVPARAPVRQYWSLTAYDRQTHALIREAPWPSRSSNTPGLAANEDGSVDLWLGPTAPAAGLANWIPTDPKSGFEVMFRLYGPEPAFAEKTWKLPDVERRAAL